MIKQSKDFQNFQDIIECDNKSIFHGYLNDFYIIWSRWSDSIEFMPGEVRTKQGSLENKNRLMRERMRCYNEFQELKIQELKKNF